MCVEGGDPGGTGRPGETVSREHNKQACQCHLLHPNMPGLMKIPLTPSPIPPGPRNRQLAFASTPANPKLACLPCLINQSKAVTTAPPAWSQEQACATFV